MFSVLSPAKLELLRHLMHGRVVSVSRLSKELGRPQPSVSRDLAFLKHSELVELKKKGRTVEVHSGISGFRLEVPLSRAVQPPTHAKQRIAVPAR
ncbi:MAG: ArsR family transcriptional regulator [Candidatus Diapherotrites archaeon]